MSARHCTGHDLSVMRLPSPVTLRRLKRTIRTRARRHPWISLLTVGAVALVLVGSATFVLSRPQPVLDAPTVGEAVAGTWTMSELTTRADAGEVSAVTVARGGADAAALTARMSDGTLWRVPVEVDPGRALGALASLGHGDILTADAWAAIRAAEGGEAEASDPARTVIGSVIPFVLIALLLAVVFRFVGRRGDARDAATWTRVLPGESTGDAPGAVPEVRLADVAGCEEAKLELTEAIEFLRSPDRFRRLGARIPRGVMLYGPPGTGKTMLARAVAAEAGVPFIAASGAEFIEKYVGVGSRRVRELFAEARAHSRAVVFIDEFDALGKARGGVNSHEEREQTLNQLLVELDGFSPNDGVVVIAATNRLDILDAAVLRPGRFNRKIHVGLPDVAGRREILDVHAKGKPLAADVDLATVARKTYGFSGAQLADLL